VRFKIHFLIWLLIFSFLFIGCDRNQTIENKIKSTVIKNSPHLTQMEAYYSLGYIHFDSNRITSDDFFIRRDLAKVAYGYNLADAKISVVKENGKKILSVKLPEPKYIMHDMKTLHLETAHKGFKPKNKDGNLVDIDKYLTEKLKKAIKEYEQKSIDTTKQISKQYFQALAFRYGFELNLEFI
jgi:hypothetical protein